MNKFTKEFLYKTNREFYINNAESFSSTRNHNWNGWNKAMVDLDSPGDPSILDIGCGNGRFASFLETQFKSFEYLGIDSNEKLLGKAKDGFAGKENIKFFTFDIEDYILNLDESKSLNSKNRSGIRENNDLIVLFGIMHHIPNFEDRVAFLNSLKSFLDQNGYLIVTLWQFMNVTEYANKVIPLSGIHSDKLVLESGDYFLDWKKNKSLRYCHDFSDQEIDKMLSLLDFKLISKFNADGKNDEMNKYLILKNI